MDDNNNNEVNVESGDSDFSSVGFQRVSKRRVRRIISSDSSSNNDDELATISVGQKRRRNSIEWRKNVRKFRRINGLQYTNSSGSIVSAKTFADVVCRCKRNCNSKITVDQRKAAFTSFFNLNSHTQQNIFIRGCVASKIVERHRPRNDNPKPRFHTFSYSIRIPDQGDITVCKKYFLDTYHISNKQLFNCSQKMQVSELIDQRGKHIRTNKIDDTPIINHINSFPAYTSHYSRSHNPQRKYLNSNLNIRKMYDLYVEKCKSDSLEPVKEKFYYHIFSTKFNLHFKHPSKDTCQMCDLLEMRIKSSVDNIISIQEKECHLLKAQTARSQMTADKLTASESTYVFCFDLQKALAFPKLTTSSAYYKRNLYVYNLGFHEFQNNARDMFVWPETEGSRGSQEIASCLVKYIKMFADTHDRIVLWSDSCIGQNRNIKTVLSLLKLVQSTDIKAKSIEMKFLVSGHTYLPNDADFAVIESNAKKIQHIYSPNDWINIIATCKRKEQFRVVKMTHFDFFSTKSLENNVCNRKTNTAGKPVNWLQMRWIKLERSKPWVIQYKNNFDENFGFENINIRKKGKVMLLNSVSQSLLYPETRAITKEKKKDMIDLLKYIPPVYHTFYKNLKTVSSQKDYSEEDIIFC